MANPATAPVSAPVIDGLPSRIQAAANQVSMATEPAMSVLTKAVAARLFAPSAEPPLKPNQPNHNSPVPRATKAMLCGTTTSPGLSLRLPTKITEASAATPADRCTTMPPAKSTRPHLARKPPPQIQWQKGM